MSISQHGSIPKIDASGVTSARRRSFRRRRVFIFALIVVLCIVSTLNWVTKPFLRAYERNQERQQLYLERERLERKLQEAKEQVRRLQTPEGKREEARRQGWTQQDEQPVILPPSKSKSR